MRIYVAGHRGMVGGGDPAAARGAAAPRSITRTRAELDLTDQAAVRAFIAAERPDVVILAAAKVGGIHANNTYPAEFIYENLMIEANVIHAAHAAGVQRLLFLGSSCIYPREAPQPMREDALLTGPLEPTNEPYAIAKIAGIKLCESYNRQYGARLPPRDADQPLRPRRQLPPREQPRAAGAAAPLPRGGGRRARDEVTIWGSGHAAARVPARRRHGRGLAVRARPAARRLSTPTPQPMLSHINVGTGADITIAELAGHRRRGRRAFAAGSTSMRPSPTARRAS